MKIGDIEQAYEAQQRRKLLLQVLDALPSDAHPNTREALAWRISIESGRLRSLGVAFVDPPEVAKFLEGGEPMRVPATEGKP